MNYVYKAYIFKILGNIKLTNILILNVPEIYFSLNFIVFALCTIHRSFFLVIHVYAKHFNMPNGVITEFRVSYVEYIVYDCIMCAYVYNSLNIYTICNLFTL